MRKILLMFLLNVSFILCMNTDEVELVRKLTEKYKFDYQVLIVEDGRRLTKFFQDDSIFTQIVTADNVQKDDNITANIAKAGYFIFLENNQETRDLLAKLTHEIFKNNILFVKSYSKQETFGIDVKFDTDVNIISETDEGLDIYEVYGLGNTVILNKFGSFVDNILDIDQANRLERRTNLMGLTLRSIEVSFIDYNSF